MMEGIVVLDTYTTGGFDSGALFAGILFNVLSLCALVLTIILVSDGESTAFFLLVPCFICIILGISAFCEVNKTPEETVYKVIIDDSVPMKEFYSRYEIVNQEGLIYSIKEKVK